jgi:hypothetical protein
MSEKLGVAWEVGDDAPLVWLCEVVSYVTTTIDGKPWRSYILKEKRNPEHIVHASFPTGE